MDIAIIGAGISGLTAGRALVRAGHRVTLFDKGRGPWGRTATRRLVDGSAGWDMGAQYFTVRDPGFEEVVRALAERGRVARWEGRVVALGAPSGGLGSREVGGGPRWVGVPGMSALGIALAEGLDLRLETRVAQVTGVGESFALQAGSGQGLGTFDALVAAIPAPQAAELLAELSPGLAEALRGVVMTPCWAVFAELSGEVGVDWDGAFCEQRSAVLAWVAREPSKPGRPGGERWTLHARPDWSRAHLEDPPERVLAACLEAFEELVGFAGLGGPVKVLTSAAHRWRFANIAEPLAPGPLGDGRLYACGDWAAGGRVEGAWLSGLRVAEAL